MEGSRGAEGCESEGEERGNECESIFEGLTRRPLLLRPLVFGPALAPELGLLRPLLCGELICEPVGDIELCIPKLT